MKSNKCHLCKESFDVNDLHTIEITYDFSPTNPGVQTTKGSFPICNDCLMIITEQKDEYKREGAEPVEIEGLIEEYKTGGQHLNVNVLNREQLIEEMENPGTHPQLTIRVSGYAVHFNRLSKEQQKEVIERTFHEGL